MNRLQPSIVRQLEKEYPLYKVFDVENDPGTSIMFPRNNQAKDLREIDNFMIYTGIDGKRLEDYSIPCVKLTTHTKKPQQYKDYRKVDDAHIAKLTSLLKVGFAFDSIATDFSEPSPIIHGTSSLPGNFVLAHNYNKSVNPAKYDPNVGQRLLKIKLEEESKRRLWDLEAYRLYRALMTIDKLHGEYAVNILNPSGGRLRDPAALIANGASAYRGKGMVVYLELNLDADRDVIGTSDGIMVPTLIAIPIEYYIALTTIITTYIELGD